MENEELIEVLRHVDFELLDQDSLYPTVHADNVVILGHLHCLPSTVELFRMIMQSDIAIDNSRIIIAPKPYSSISSAVRDLRTLGVHLIDEEIEFLPGQYDKMINPVIQSACEYAMLTCNKIKAKHGKPRLIIIDDGGMMTDVWWRKYPKNGIEVISIQQTASGMWRQSQCLPRPHIDVARSAAKKIFESRIISEGVLRKVKTLDVIKPGISVGVVGMGVLGRAIFKELKKILAEKGSFFKLFVYDKEALPREYDKYKCNNIYEVLQKSDVVLGCTGRNWLSTHYLADIKHKIQFISCSSRDVEFQNLLNLVRDRGGYLRNLYQNFEVEVVEGQKHYIANGGFPINFDRVSEYEKLKEIAITRGLIFGALLQAFCIKFPIHKEYTIKLAPSFQKYLVDRWLELSRITCEQFGLSRAAVDSQDWWSANSAGENYIPAVLNDADEEISSSKELYIYIRNVLRNKATMKLLDS